MYLPPWSFHCLLEKKAGLLVADWHLIEQAHLSCVYKSLKAAEVVVDDLTLLHEEGSDICSVKPFSIWSVKVLWYLVFET